VTKKTSVMIDRTTRIVFRAKKFGGMKKLQISWHFFYFKCKMKVKKCLSVKKLHHWSIKGLY